MTFSSTRTTTTSRNRSSSNESATRGSKSTHGAFLTVSSSAKKGATITQSTPRTTTQSKQNQIPQSTITKVLQTRNPIFNKNSFSEVEERYRKPFFIGAAAVGSGSLVPGATAGHGAANDKHRLQERVNRITEYLIMKSSGGNIDGLGVDFQNRGLRQMTFGHFLAIVNHFLRYIVGERFTVSENYVEDICNLLPKLHYPHPINKSWLKAPNTQQAFVNIILILDFLMEFVIPSFDENDDHNHNCDALNQECYFDFDLPEKTYIPDKKFLRQLINYAGKSYLMWKNSKNDEYLKVEKECIDYFVCKIIKSDYVQSVDDLQNEIVRLQVQLKEVQECLEKYNNSKLQDDVLQLNADIKMVKDELNNINAEKGRLKIIIEKYEWEEINIKNKCEKLEKHLKEQIISDDDNNIDENQQQRTIEYRNKLISNVTVLKHNLGIEERTLSDVRNRSYEIHTESLHLSIEIADLVENFNGQIRNVVYSKSLLKGTQIPLKNIDKFQLPLNLTERKSIDHILILLKKMNEQILEKNENVEREIVETQEKYLYLETVILHRMNLKLNTLRSQNTHELNKLQQYRKGYENALEKLNTQRDSLMESIKVLDCEIIQSKIYINEKCQLLQELDTTSELKIKELEEKHRLRYEKKHQYLSEYKKLLNSNQANFDNLRKLVNDDRVMIERLKDKLNQLVPEKNPEEVK